MPRLERAGASMKRRFSSSSRRRGAESCEPVLAILERVLSDYSYFRVAMALGAKTSLYEGTTMSRMTPLLSMTLLCSLTACGVMSTDVAQRSVEQSSQAQDTQPSESSEDQTSDTPEESDDSDALSSDRSTCKSLIAEVIRISKENSDEGDPKILQVYKPRTVKDRQAKYEAGDLKVPKGKTKVTALLCNGTAAWSSGDDSKLQYSLQYDLNDDAYVYFQPAD